jgi:EmrB/QacA subfamily drug resistance transporter
MQVSNTQKWWVVAVVTLGMFMSTLDTSIVSVTLPQMQAAFHAGVEDITWVVTAYFLAQAAVIPVVGYLSDRFGSKQVFLFTLAVFTISSLLCALSTTKEALIAFRVFQGLGGGALLPLGFAIVYRTFPPDKRASSTAIVSIPIIMAPSFGPTLGGYLGTNFNWNAIFTINVPLGIVALFLGFLYLQADKSGETGASQKYFDVLGLLLSVAGFTTLVYGISEASSKGWNNANVLAPLLIGTAILMFFVGVELKVPDPVMDLRLFMNYTFSIANVLTWVVMGMLYGSLFLLPLFFQTVLGETALTSGEFMIGQGIAVGIGLAISGAIYNRVGPRVLIVSGMLLMAVGTYGLAQINVNTTGISLQPWLVARGLGIGFTTQSLQVLALSVVSNRAMAKASSLYSTVRQIAGAVGLAALTTYLTQQITTHATDIGSALQTGLRTHNLTGVAATCAQAGGKANACVIQHAEATGLADVFLVIMISYAACAVLGLVVGRDPAIEAQKQAKKAKVAPAPDEAVQVASTRSVILTPIPNGDEIMGPEILLWRYPGNDIMNGSLLTVESNHFCVLKSRDVILNVYETGQHIVQTPDLGSMQLAFDGELISLQYEVLYINRAQLLIKASGVALSPEMAELDYSIDYYIHIATPEDALLLIQHMPYLDYTLTTQEVNTYAAPIIEETINQLLLITPLEQLNRKRQDLSQLVHQHLQPFLATYGITLDTVEVLELALRDERIKELVTLKTLGLSKLDVVRHSTAMPQSLMNHHTREQQEDQEQNQYIIWRKTLDHYANEITALHAELEHTRTTVNQSLDAHHTHLQELSRAISASLQASAPISKISSLPNPQVTHETGQPRDAERFPLEVEDLTNSQVTSETGQLKAQISPLGRGMPTAKRILLPSRPIQPEPELRR